MAVRTVTRALTQERGLARSVPSRGRRCGQRGDSETTVLTPRGDLWDEEDEITRAAWPQCLYQVPCRMLSASPRAPLSGRSSHIWLGLLVLLLSHVNLGITTCILGCGDQHLSSSLGDFYTERFL